MSPSPQSPDAQELAGQIDAIRADIQSLTSTVSRMFFFACVIMPIHD